MTYTIDVHSLIYLLDEANHTGVGAEVSAINGLIGEELLLGVFRDYLERNGNTSVRITHTNPKVKQFATDKSWKWLDGEMHWIDAKGANHAALLECKNWTGHSMGTTRLPVQCQLAEQQQVSTDHWNKLIKNARNYNKSIAKIAFPVTKDPNHVNHFRYLLMWLPAALAMQNLIMSRMTCPNTNIPINVFSASNHLRTILAQNVTTITLNMPLYDRRVTQLRALGL